MDDCSFLLSTLAASILTLVIQVTDMVLTDTVTDSLVLYFFSSEEVEDLQMWTSQVLRSCCYRFASQQQEHCTVLIAAFLIKKKTKPKLQTQTNSGEWF